MSDHICWLNHPRKKNWIFMQISACISFLSFWSQTIQNKKWHFCGGLWGSTKLWAIIVTPSLIWQMHFLRHSSHSSVIDKKPACRKQGAFLAYSGKLSTSPANHLNPFHNSAVWENQQLFWLQVEKLMEWREGRSLKASLRSWHNEIKNRNGGLIAGCYPTRS